MPSLHDILRGDVMPLSGINVSIGRNSYDPPAPVVPINDIHTRSLVFHDLSQSGILTYNAQRGILNFEPSNSGAQSVVTAVYFDAYDGTGSTNISTTNTTVVINTIRNRSHPEIFSLASNELQINMSGIYNICYRCSADNPSTTTRSSISWWLERQAPGGSFAEIPGSRSYSYHRISTNGEDTATCTIIQEAVAVGDKFRIRGVILGGAANLPLLQNGSSITVRKLG